MTTLNTAAKKGEVSKATATAKALANTLRRTEIGEARRMRTRSRLLQAAMQVLGHEAGRFATVDEFIARAGVSRGTFYNHFTSREQLLEALSLQLSHNFNQTLDQGLGPNPDPAIRASTWIRHYLHRIRRDHAWGWTLVNVSLTGPRLMGEESYNAARDNLDAGCAMHVFKIDHREAALDLTLGGLLASAISTLRGTAPDDYPEATAYVALRAYGVSDARAKRIVELPLIEMALVGSDQ